MKQKQPPRAVVPFLRGLHHVAIAVESLETARGMYEHDLGMRALPIEYVPSQRVNVLVLFSGGQRVELVEPVGDDSPVTKFLKKRGPGIHHLAWRVDSVKKALERLKKTGVKLIDETPQPGSHGTIVAFIHPHATGGVLMELVEDPRWTDPGQTVA